MCFTGAVLNQNIKKGIDVKIFQRLEKERVSPQLIQRINISLFENHEGQYKKKIQAHITFEYYKVIKYVKLNPVLYVKN